MVDMNLKPIMMIGACECLIECMAGHNDHSNILERLQC